MMDNSARSGNSDLMLVATLEQLVRGPKSQVQLCSDLHLSKARVNYYVKNLLDLGLIEPIDCALPEQDAASSGRARRRARQDMLQELGLKSGHLGQKPLGLKRDFAYAVRILNSQDFMECELFAWDKCAQCRARLELPSVHNLSTCLMQVKKSVQALCAQAQVPPEQVRLILFATRGTLEQGYHGMLYRDNSLVGTNIPLADKLTAVTGIATYVCNYAFGHLLALLHDPFSKIDNALVLLCGDGSVALGVFVNGQILFGPNQSFLECAHLPYERNSQNFEQALGQYGPNTEDALEYAIATLAPMFAMRHIIVSGPTFQDKVDAIAAVTQRFAQSHNRLQHRLIIDYRQREIDNSKLELGYFACEQICHLLEPKCIKKSLASLSAEEFPH